MINRRQVRIRKRLEKKVRRGFRDYPIATTAYYGPNNKTATKVVVGIILQKDGEAEFLKKWFLEGGDVRFDTSIHEEIYEFIQGHNVLTVSMVDKIIGCPHEEGIDYAEGENCPQCPYWENRDRWTNEIIH